MNDQSKGQQLAVLFFVGCLLFNFPLLSLFSQHGMLFGTPIIYLYILVIWFALICLMATIIEGK